MARDARFWRNVTIIGLLHIALLLAFIRWSREPKKALTSNIVWMNGGAGSSGEAVVEKKSAPKRKEEPAPTPEVKREIKREETEKEEEEKPILTAAKSEIQLSTPTPRPTATATPESTATPKPKPSPKPAPKSTPKATPKPTPKKKLLAKASPKPKKEEEEDSEDTKKKKEVAKAALAKKDSDSDKADESEEKPVKKAVSAHAGKKTGSGGTDAGSTEGSGGESEFGWYGNMLHDRFYSEWMQPTTSVPAGAKISALVKIRIERDGSISNFKIVKPSGISVVDESVEAVAKQVTQVDPLPAGLGSGGHYDVNINFEFNPSE
jgi:colicin import membrane protein